MPPSSPSRKRARVDDDPAPPFLDLPNEMHFEVMRWLSPSERKRLAATCRQMWYAFHENKRFFRSERIISARSTVNDAPGGFTRNMCVARNGNVLMIDSYIGMVTEITRVGRLVRHLGRGVLEDPWGVEYDAMSDEVIVSDMRTNLLSVFAYADGRFLRHLGTEAGLSWPSGIALIPSRRILVAGYNNHRVVVLSLGDGSMIASFGTRGSGEGQMSWPSSVAFDPTTNRIFVSELDNHRVSVFDASNFGFLATFGSYGSGDGQFQYPRQLLVDEIGQIVVADRSNKRVCVFAKDFSFVRSICCNGLPCGVALDLNGDLFVGHH